MSFIKKTYLLLLLLIVTAGVKTVVAQAGVALAKSNDFNTNAELSRHAGETGGPVLTTSLPRAADSSVNHMDLRYRAALDRLQQQAALLEKFVKQNNYNTEYLFLVDMSLPSGKNRFFIYNLNKKTPEHAALVTHGVGSNKYDTDEPLQFSNMPYSFKTSLGKYKIGNAYHGRFGLAYKLYGLDSTNDKAYERAIVLHGHKQIPDAETYPGYIIVSAGCPTVSPAFLGILNKYITAAKKPILLWIYN